MKEEIIGMSRGVIEKSERKGKLYRICKPWVPLYKVMEIPEVPYLVDLALIRITGGKEEVVLALEHKIKDYQEVLHDQTVCWIWMDNVEEC